MDDIKNFIESLKFRKVLYGYDQEEVIKAIQQLVSLYETNNPAMHNEQYLALEEAYHDLQTQYDLLEKKYNELSRILNVQNNQVKATPKEEIRPVRKRVERKVEEEEVSNYFDAHKEYEEILKKLHRSIAAKPIDDDNDEIDLSNYLDD